MDAIPVWTIRRALTISKILKCVKPSEYPGLRYGHK